MEEEGDDAAGYKRWEENEGGEVAWKYNLDKNKFKKKIVGNLIIYMFINNIHSLRFILILNEVKMHIY